MYEGMYTHKHVLQTYTYREGREGGKRDGEKEGDWKKTKP